MTEDRKLKIVVAGGTGFIGRALVSRLLREGHMVSVLTRSAPAAASALSRGIRLLEWDTKTTGPWSSAFADADAVLNFAGEPIAGRLWSQRRKELLWRSRIDATSAIVNAIRAAPARPRVLISASGVDYYGDVPEGDVLEGASSSPQFLSRLCAEWEKVAAGAGEAGARVVQLRIGLVLGDRGGVLARTALPFKFFVGGPLGSGRQWISWIHREDLAGAVVHLLQASTVSGPVNVSAPNPVRMEEFSREIARALRRPCWFRVSPALLRLLLGEMSTVVLSGRRAIPTRLTRSGFSFKFPELPAALEDVLR